MASVNSVFSFKVLASITVAVLLLHLAALRASPMTLDLSPPEPARAFITRSIEAVAPPLANPPRDPQATPRRTQAARPRPAAREAVPPMSSGPQDTAIQDPANWGASQLALAPGSPQPSGDLNLPAAASKPPGSVRLKYQVRANKFPYRLNAELLWQQTGDQYAARLEIGVFGQARVQTSRGQITAQGLAPLRFSDKFRTEVAAHFNRAQGKVTFSANTPDVPLQPGAQDRLSVLVQLAALLAGAPERYPKGTTLAIQTIGPRDADTWLFTVGEPETLALPGGEQATLKLTRNPRQAFDQTVELWMAPALGYLPARVRITEANGDAVDQQWLATEAPI